MTEKKREEEIMLNGIPKILSPELLKVLCEMGHGDRIVIADGNFPCESDAGHGRGQCEDADLVGI